MWRLKMDGNFQRPLWPISIILNFSKKIGEIWHQTALNQIKLRSFDKNWRNTTRIWTRLGWTESIFYCMPNLYFCWNAQLEIQILKGLNYRFSEARNINIVNITRPHFSYFRSHLTCIANWSIQQNGVLVVLKSHMIVFVWLPKVSLDTL